MLLATKKAAEHVAAAATHTHAEQPPCEATGHDPPTHLGDQPEVLDHGTQSASRLPGSRAPHSRPLYKT